MTRVCAAQEIGSDAFALVTIIAHTEDAKRYTAAVTWWNEQLQSVLGFSWDKLNRARKRAIKEGWLHYEAGGKGKVGKYWATIPERFSEIPDGAVDEDSPPILRTSADTSTEDAALSSAPVRKETGEKPDTNAITCTSAERSLGETWEKPGTSLDPSIPSPNPSPNPKEATASESFSLSAEQTTKKLTAEDIPVPAELDTPRFRKAWAEWLVYRRGEKMTVKPPTIRGQLTKLAKMGPDDAAESLDNAVAAGWKGFFPLKRNNSHGRPTQRYKPGGSVEAI
jgi:hypothetical protein